MTEKVKCPICGHDASYEAHHESMGLVEEYEGCLTCGYYSEFAYGAYHEVVNGKEFIWSWKTKPDNPIFRRIKRAEFMARRNWRKREVRIEKRYCEKV